MVPTQSVCSIDVVVVLSAVVKNRVKHIYLVHEMLSPAVLCELLLSTYTHIIIYACSYNKCD